MEKFRQNIEQETNLDALEILVGTLKDSEEYEVLERGQGLFTRITGRKTSSVEALEEMIADQQAHIRSSYSPIK